MPQDETKINPQDINNDLTPDEAAASLAFATRLNEQMMPKAPPESSQTQEMGSPSDETPEMREDTMMEDNHPKKGEMEEMPGKEDHKAEMKEMMEEMKKEVKEMIKETIQEVLGNKETNE